MKNLATCHVVKNNVQLGLYIQNYCLVLVSTENVDFCCIELTTPIEYEKIK